MPSAPRGARNARAIPGVYAGSEPAGNPVRQALGEVHRAVGTSKGRGGARARRGTLPHPVHRECDAGVASPLTRHGSTQPGRARAGPPWPPRGQICGPGLLGPVSAPYLRESPPGPPRPSVIPGGGPSSDPRIHETSALPVRGCIGCRMEPCCAAVPPGRASRPRLPVAPAGWSHAVGRCTERDPPRGPGSGQS